MYPEWIQLSVDAFNEKISENNIGEDKHLIIKTYTKRQPEEINSHEKRFDLIKKLLVEENIFMEIEYASDRINIDYMKKL